MTSISQSKEDLEERIARIKKRNEEIEKKYREAEADRLMALKDNAMVAIKPPKDDDWPREHKYDKLDFTYDVDEQKLAEQAELDEKRKERLSTHKLGKDHKIFADPPPPDPAYSFLADVERDGEKAIQKQNKNTFERRNNNNNKSGRGHNGHNGHNNGHNGHQRGGGGNSGSGRGGGKNGKDDRMNHRSFSNSTSNDGDNWRNDDRHANKGGGGGSAGHNERWRRETEGREEKHLNLKLEPNLTVSVSQDGEFKSVKVTSPPIIGSGRVGPRQSAKPQFQFQTSPTNNDDLYNQHSNNRKGENSVASDQGQQHHKQQQHHSQNEGFFNRNHPNRKSDNKKPSNQSSNKGCSVQDRLSRNRGSEGSVNAQFQDSGNSNKPATLKTISKIIEQNAEIEMRKENDRLVSQLQEFRRQNNLKYDE